MIIKQNKNDVRSKRHLRVRQNLSGTSERPRLNVFRSTSHIYVQIIDDTKAVTLASSSTIAKGVKVKGNTKLDAARIVGEDIAKKALASGIKQVVFDRGGYQYTGRVRALAEGARAAGLEF